MAFLMCCSLLLHEHDLPSVVQVGTPLCFLNQWKSITSNRFVLNMVKGNHLLLRYCPPLICTLKQFIIKATLAHHVSIQKVDELLAKGPFNHLLGDL